MARRIFRILLLVLFSQQLFAHGFLPARLEIEEISPERYMVMWEPNDSAESGELVGLQALSLGLPDTCHKSPIVSPSDKAQYFQLDCSNSSLRGQTISVRGLAWNKMEALVSVRLLGNVHHKIILKNQQAEFQVSRDRQSRGYLAGFFQSGVWHIWMGWDHLLFLLTMLFLFRTWKQRVQVITAFTVGHSLSLFMATMKWLVPPAGPIEVLIAWTIAFAAYEVLREGKRAGPSLTYSLPWVVTGIFGFIHGFGFASVLREAGVQGSEAIAPLLAFNLGVEAGQLLVVFISLAFAASFRLFVSSAIWRNRLKIGISYTTGSLAMFWVFERLLV